MKYDIDKLINKRIAKIKELLEKSDNISYSDKVIILCSLDTELGILRGIK